MRRLRVTFTRNSGSVMISYDSAAENSRLTTGTVVPEKSLILGIIVPFLPPVVRWYGKKRKKKKKRIIQ